MLPTKAYAKMTSKSIYRGHGLYICGMSLSKVAERLGTTRQRLHGHFKRMGLATRPLKKGVFLEHLGIKYYKTKGGYYRGGKDRTPLHHIVWGEPVPKGSVLHFLTEDKTTTDKNNLCLVKKSDMSRLWSQGKNQWSKK